MATGNEELYGYLPRVSDKIASRRLQLAGHCFRYSEFSPQPLVLWIPTHGGRREGGLKKTYVDVLMLDSGAATPRELAAMMEDPGVWRSRVVGRLSQPSK